MQARLWGRRFSSSWIRNRAKRGSADPYVEATHLPRLLTTAGAIELEYDAYCIDPAADEAESSCRQARHSCALERVATFASFR